MNIENLRRQIDRVDSQILALLNERVEIVIKLWRLKRETDLQLYDPQRERKILDQLFTIKSPKLDNQAVSAVFKCIMKECRRLSSKRL